MTVGPRGRYTTGGLRNKGVKFAKINLSEFTRFFQSDWWRAVVLVTERLCTNQIEKSVQNRRDRFLRQELALSLECFLVAVVWCCLLALLCWYCLFCCCPYSSCILPPYLPRFCPFYFDSIFSLILSFPALIVPPVCSLFAPYFADLFVPLSRLYPVSIVPLFAPY